MKYMRVCVCDLNMRYLNVFVLKCFYALHKSSFILCRLFQSGFTVKKQEVLIVYSYSIMKLIQLQ